MRFRIVVALVCVLAVTAGAVAQRRAFDLTTPTPIATLDSVWIEELTWMEVRDAMKAGKTTALIVAGSTEQNGPYVPTKEYYDSWTAADGAWDSLGVPKTRDDGIHDDYSVNSIIATVDPAKIRFKQRQDAGKASINGQSLLPLETTVANGKKLVEIRAAVTVEAIKKARAAK